MSEMKMDRRTFLKTLTAAGASAAVMSTVPQMVAAQTAPTVVMPNPEFVKGVTGAAYETAVSLATKGAFNNLQWQPGDGIKFLAPEKIGTGKYVDDFKALGKAKLLDIYTKMVQSRQWESQAKDLFLGGKDPIYGTFHMYVGEESIACAAMAALEPKDVITSTHRGHGHLIAKGADMYKMSAEIRAKTEGYCKAFGGSMHLTSMELGIGGMNGIVGGGWHLASGAALSMKINKSSQVSVCFAGDGAANSRYFLNSLRNAKLYGLPYIAFIENNFYNAGTAGARTSAVKYQAELAKGLGISCVTIDGTDVAAVWAATRDAVASARKGVPSVIEAVAMRWYDHSGFAGGKVGQDGAFGLPYRSDEEVKAWIGRDPNIKFKNWLIEQKIATADELSKIDADGKAAAAKAWADSLKGTAPKPQDGLKNVWMNKDVEATQWFDRKGPAVTTYQFPEYLVELHKNMPFEA